MSGTADFDAIASIRETIPGKCGGNPTYPGTRLQPKDVLAQSKFGGVDYILECYPSLSKAQIEYTLRYGA